ncbi:hypothetical protein J5J83_20945 [Azoarcus sp. L1K30]|uniref:hypothetical protein n=1 Tax=Azoarcus sp. L1K30 TaxID=2820277 RepID=UPI001B82BCDA|nr:hypothetical protein [Azoarcus sp. L1K30]MBR0568600.1 hypothetical protein [Azoarcus sp. L1K30]
MLALVSCLPVSELHAEVITVGIGESVTRIAEAARLARDGDIVLIKSGNYENDVAVWTQKKLEIRGLGIRPVLLASGASAEDKAIWVFRDGQFSVDNVEFRGARVPDGNGAGIRFERGSLEVNDCVFDDNQNAILTGNDENAELRIRDSEFRHAPHDAARLPHLLYVGTIRHFTLEGSRLHQGFQGHLIKSRAHTSEIRYNLILDGEGGESSYELEFPNGGTAIVVGNVIGQSRTSANRVVLAYGAEGGHWKDNQLLISHNTFINEGWRPAWFARVWEDKLPQDLEVLAINNLTVGLGVFTLALPGTHTGNQALLPGALDPATLDLTLGADSLFRRHVAAVDGPLRQLLTPTAEFALPRGTVTIKPPQSWVPGAFQGGDVALKATTTVDDTP